MRKFQSGIIIILTLLITTGLIHAQDSVSVVGSGVVIPVIEALKTGSESSVNIQSEVTGTRNGFERFCQGQADITTASRAINAEEDRACASNEVDYTELLIAHNIIAFVVPADASYAQCLTPADLNALFAPSAQTSNWNQVGSTNLDLALTILLPAQDSETSNTLDQIIEGDGLRGDATTRGNDTEMIKSVTGNGGTIGVVSLPAALAAGDSIKLLEFAPNEAVGCQIPSVENVEQRLYPASSSLLVYVNRASLNKTGLNDLLAFSISDAAKPVVEDLGFAAPGSAATESNQNALSGTGSTRPFSETVTSFQIPADATGQILIAGSASGRDYINSITQALSAQYSGLTSDIKLQGQPDGVRRFCNGEIDILVMTSPLTAEQSQNCEANNIKTLTINLGVQAVVLVANAASEHLACLTTEQITTIWESKSSKEITNWNQVNSSFPDQSITLFTPDAGDTHADLLLEKSAGTSIPVRDDTVTNRDPLYRAAATANVEGALTFMKWSDYQKVLENDQPRIQLVAVDAGNGCITPDEQSIANSTYPLSNHVQLLVKTASLNTVHVQSVTWFMAQDSNFGLFAQAGLNGVPFGDLATLRQTLQGTFLEAAEAAQQAAAEATPEVTVEATAEATASP